MIDSDPHAVYRYPVSDIGDQDEAPEGIMPSQTVGPYVHIGLTTPGAEDMVDEHSMSFSPDEVIDVTFSVTDGAGERVKDAMIEIWQADGQGIYPSPLDERSDEGSLKGWNPLLGAGIGRGMADGRGEVTFRTRRPGAAPAELDTAAGTEGDTEASHLKVGVFARGILERLYTRAYFPGEDQRDDRDGDPVLAVVPEDRRERLIMQQESENSYRMDIVLQHEDATAETPFFRI